MVYENQESHDGSHMTTTIEGSNWPSFDGWKRNTEDVPVPTLIAPMYFCERGERTIAEFHDLKTAVDYCHKYNLTLRVYNPTPEEYEEELRVLREKNRLNPLY